MLRRSREADHPTDERVVATVGTPATLGKQLIQTVRRLLGPTNRHIEPQCPQPRSGHCHEQRRLTLAPRGEIGKASAHKLVTGQATHDAASVACSARERPRTPLCEGPRPSQLTSAGSSTTDNSTSPISRRASRGSISPAPSRVVDSAPQATPKRRHWSGERPS
jgi:hypothetical protein